MGYETEQRPTHVEVQIVRCDVCQRVADAPHYVCPEGWLKVTRRATLEAVLCSMECVRQWASGSAELTKIARNRFEEVTHGTPG